MPLLVFGVVLGLNTARRSRYGLWMDIMKGLGFRQEEIVGDRRFSFRSDDGLRMYVRGMGSTYLWAGSRGKSMEIVAQLLTDAPRFKAVQASLLGRRGSAITKTGDPVFDEAFWLTGDEAVILALFDRQLRRRYLELSERNVLVENGKVSTIVRDRMVRNFEDLTKDFKTQIDMTLSLARASRSPQASDMSEMLATNAREEPLASVRQRNQEILERLPPAAIKNSVRARADESS